MHYRFFLSTVLLLIVPGNAFAANAETGKKIFDQSCTYCHKADYDDKFGPGLAGVTERRDAAWLDKFLTNPAEMIKTDEYAQTLHENNKYGLTMPSLPEMQDAKNRQDVIEYLKTVQ
ncbi:MAG: cytochrome c [Mariprofundaceae bacterium]